MKPIRFITIAILFLLINAFYCSASEEDFAVVTSADLVAQTTCKEFGEVNVKAQVNRIAEGFIVSMLSVSWKGKAHPIPKEELQRITDVDLSSLVVSCEGGYPSVGLGPYLYIRFKKFGTETKYYRLIFDMHGFKELKIK